MLSEDLCLGERVVIETIMYLSSKVIVRGVKLELPNSVLNAFDTALDPLDLLLEILPIMHDRLDVIGALKISWMKHALATRVSKLMSDDDQKLPKECHKQAYIAQLATTPHFVTISGVFKIAFIDMVEYPGILLNLLRNKSSKTAIKTMIAHGTPESINFAACILPSMIRMNDIPSLNEYIRHSSKANPEYRNQACNYTHSLIMFQFELLDERLNDLTPFGKHLQPIKSIQTNLTALIHDQVNPMFTDTVETIGRMKSALWLVAKAQTDAKQSSMQQIKDTQLCLSGLLSKYVSLTTQRDKCMLARLIVTRLCRVGLFHALGQRLANEFEMSCFGSKFKRDPAFIEQHSSQARVEYTHKSFIITVNCEDDLTLMEKLIYQSGNGSDPIALGLSLNYSPSIDSNLNSPAIIQISINEHCRPTTDYAFLDTMIRTHGSRACSFTFILYLVDINCCRVMDWILHDKDIIKIVFGADQVNLFRQNSF